MILWSIGLFFAVALAIAVARGMRLRKILRQQRDRRRKCVCGYIVENLDSPRCPECGRAIGFDTTFEEMGISQSELEEAARRKALRKKGGT